MLSGRRGAAIMATLIAVVFLCLISTMVISIMAFIRTSSSDILTVVDDEGNTITTDVLPRFTNATSITGGVATLDEEGNLTLSSMDGLAAAATNKNVTGSVLRIGAANADTIRVGQEGHSTEFLGSMSVQEPAVFQDVIQLNVLGDDAPAVGSGSGVIYTTDDQQLYWKTTSATTNLTAVGGVGGPTLSTLNAVPRFVDTIGAELGNTTVIITNDDEVLAAAYDKDTGGGSLSIGETNATSIVLHQPTSVQGSMDVSDFVGLSDITTPSGPGAGVAKLYKKSTGLYWLADTDSEINISHPTLQQVYDNGQTVTTTSGAVEIQRGGVADTDVILEGKNGAGTVTFSVAGNGDVVTNNLLVNGTVTSVNSEIVNVKDNYVYLNSDYEINVAKSGGLTVNYFPTAVVDTVAGAFTAGVAAVSQPTVVTTGSATFAPNDIIQITGGDDILNNGLFEVLTHTGTLLSIRGVGVSATLQAFTQNQFATNAVVAGSIVKVNVSVIQSNSDGNWYVGSGSDSATFTFDPLQYTGSDIVAGVGAEATPSITFQGRTDTGMWSSAVQTLNLSTAGTERLRIDPSGTVNVLQDITASGTVEGLTLITRSGEVRMTGAELNFLSGSNPNRITAPNLQAEALTITDGTTTYLIVDAVDDHLEVPVNLVVTGNITVSGHVDGVDIAALNTTTTNHIADSSIHYTQASITTTGALTSGSIASGFGNIDNGPNTITTTGAISGGSLTSTGGITNTGGIITTLETSNIVIGNANTGGSIVAGATDNVIIGAESTVTLTTGAKQF